ncbi:MAG: uracil permease, partial [Pseudomonadota bacterium]|nr:uracil permease [Pseudomonadota bacterium]
IAVVGLNTLIRHQVDLAESRNLVIVGVTLVFGIGGMVLGHLEGIALCAVAAIILNLILPGSREAWGKAMYEQKAD